MTITPPFAYYGGKTTLATTIADLLPAHDHYVEPFAGSLAVLLAKPATKWETVNDLDGDLVTFWRVLRDRPEELARAAMLTPHSRAELAAANDLDVPDEIERARRVWVRLSQSRGNTMRNVAAGDWRYRQDPKMGTSMPDYVTAYARRMEACAKRLKNVSLENRDALEMIREYGQHEAVCIYADPPYLGTTRRTRSNYRHEMVGDDLHREFADALHACKASVVISGYASPLYEELFPGWYRTTMKAPPALSGDTGRVEVLWSNRPLGEATLFDGIGA
jgi:DNA adenine methylase